MRSTGDCRVWITGCTGFLGTRLGQSLGAAGVNVIGFSRRQCVAGVPGTRLDLAADDAPIRLRELCKANGSPTVIIHAASRQPGEFALGDYVQSNVLATANLLEALDSLSPDLFIFISTIRVYGRPKSNPVSEEDAPHPESAYAITKLAAEMLVDHFAGRTRTLTLRLPSLFGKGQADSFVDGLARLAVKGLPIDLFNRGRTLHDALHVSEVVEAIKSCLRCPTRIGSRRLNLGCGRPVTAFEYANTLTEALGSSSQLVPVDHRPASTCDLYADIRNAQREIGFEPQPLAVTMRKYADELRSGY